MRQKTDKLYKAFLKLREQACYLVSQIVKQLTLISINEWTKIIFSNRVHYYDKFLAIGRFFNYFGLVTSIQ